MRCVLAQEAATFVSKRSEPYLHALLPAARRTWAPRRRSETYNAGKWLATSVLPVLQFVFLHRGHREVAGSRRQGHVGERRIDACRGRHARTVGHEHVFHVVDLVVLVEH